MKKFKIISALAIILMLGAGAAQAADTHGAGMAHGGSMQEFNQEYMKAMDDMHTPMMKGIMDADPDAAFVRGMLWHHRGAVDMSKIQLKYGKDPEMLKMAREIIDAQEPEIRQMQDWLKKRNLPE